MRLNIGENTNAHRLALSRHGKWKRRPNFSNPLIGAGLIQYGVAGSNLDGLAD